MKKILNKHFSENPCRAAVKLALGGMAVLASGAALAFSPFVAKDIRVEGLQRISAGTVFNYLPIKQGDQVDDARSSDAIKALFKTGFFRDVSLERDGDTLVVFVAERPAISSITIEGNEDIPSDQLKESLKQVGFSEGRVFDRSMLDKVEQELKRQYLSLGKYAARVESTVTAQERNRVAVRIDIAEGEASRIHHIDIIGNRTFSDDELLSRLQSDAHPMAPWSDADKYSRQKLSGDLETIRSFYMDRGFINFNIDSTQVSITPDKQDVYITVNVSEGDRYRVSDVRVEGDTLVPKEQLRELIKLAQGDWFSRRAVTEGSDKISERLGDVGFAFANVNAIPTLDEQKHEVALTFFVDPGKRVYVNRVNVSGNARTRDEVIRRELRQMEGGWFSTEQIKRSRTRLDRLGYFESVNVETPATAGSSDQVDVNYDVKERDAFGNLSFGVGYGDSQGFLVNASVSQDNFLGTGKRFSLSFNNSTVNTVYSLSVTNPYYTLDGVSRTLHFNYRTTDAAAANVSNYTTDTASAGVMFGIPLSEYRTFRIGVDVDQTKLKPGSYSSTEINKFITDNGDLFNDVKLVASWVHDSRNRAIFPTSGRVQTLSVETALPVSSNSVSFYKTSYQHRNYFPLGEKTTLLAKGELSYGNSYGSTTTLPPFERYYAGGISTVRGFRANSLGPKDSLGDPWGGNARVIGNLELIFPGPFSDNTDKDSLRLSAFIDAGNVFDTSSKVKFSDLRYSTGMSLLWLTPVGALTFSYAKPLNDKPGDNTESFQFSLGSPF